MATLLALVLQPCGFVCPQIPTFRLHDQVLHDHTIASKENNEAIETGPVDT